MYKSGDVFIAKLPRGFYGAFRIVKAGVLEGTKEEAYIIAITSYFDVEKPKLSDPRLRETAKMENYEHIGLYQGYKWSGPAIDKYFEHLGNLPPTENEMKLRLALANPGSLEGFHILDIVQGGFTSKIFHVNASPEERKAYDKECKANEKCEVYRYLDDKSDMFFAIDYGNHILAIHLGETGTSGELSLESFPSGEECSKEATKIIASFVKKGYEHAHDFKLNRNSGKITFGKEIIEDEENKGALVKQETYRFVDDKSDKFWRIEWLESELVVNHGKTGTIGKYQYKDLWEASECEKEVKKLINSKTKKGYTPYPEFDLNNHIYIDDRGDESIGPHLLTSHPSYRKHFKDEFYYDSGDDAAPFGNDEGADVLYSLEDNIRRKKDFDFLNYPKHQIEVEWGMAYYPPDNISKEDCQRLLKEDEDSLTQSDMVTYAAALAQIKITGRVDAQLKVMAINAMKRKLITDEILGYDYAAENLTKMIKDLANFPFMY